MAWYYNEKLLSYSVTSFLYALTQMFGLHFFSRMKFSGNEFASKFIGCCFSAKMCNFFPLVLLHSWATPKSCNMLTLINVTRQQLKRGSHGISRSSVCRLCNLPPASSCQPVKLSFSVPFPDILSPILKTKKKTVWWLLLPMMRHHQDKRRWTVKG